MCNKNPPQALPTNVHQKKKTEASSSSNVISFALLCLVQIGTFPHELSHTFPWAKFKGGLGTFVHLVEQLYAWKTRASAVTSTPSTTTTIIVSASSTDFACAHGSSSSIEITFC